MTLSSEEMRVLRELFAAITGSGDAIAVIAELDGGLEARLEGGGTYPYRLSTQERQVLRSIREQAKRSVKQERALAQVWKSLESDEEEVSDV